MKRALVNSHVSVMCPCLVLLGAELMARCACECFEFVRVYILCVQRAFSCGDAPSITAGTHKQERVWARVRAQRGGQGHLLFWQVMVPVHRCFRHQVKKLQGRQKGAKFKSGPQTKFQNRRYRTNFGGSRARGALTGETHINKKMYERQYGSTE